MSAWPAELPLLQGVPGAAARENRLGRVQLRPEREKSGQAGATGEMGFSGSWLLDDQINKLSQPFLGLP